MNMYTLLFLKQNKKQKTNKGLLFSTENSAQYSLII